MRAWLYQSGPACKTNKVDPPGSHMLVSKIKPCMSQHKHGETANGSPKQWQFACLLACLALPCLLACLLALLACLLAIFYKPQKMLHTSFSGSGLSMFWWIHVPELKCICFFLEMLVIFCFDSFSRKGMKTCLVFGFSRWKHIIFWKTLPDEKKMKIDFSRKWGGSTPFGCQNFRSPLFLDCFW